METKNNSWWCGTPYFEMMANIKRQEFGGPLIIYSEDIIERLYKLGYEEDIPAFVIYLEEMPDESRIKNYESRGRIVYNGIGNEQLKKVAHKSVNEDLQCALNEHLKDLHTLYELLDE